MDTTKWLNYLFLALSVGLTIVSLHAGFYVYLGLFGLTSALLISGVFELLRLSTIYSIKKFKKTFKLPAILLYTIIATICFLAAVISFNSKVIKEDDLLKANVTRQMNKDIYEIKHTYSVQVDERIKELLHHIDEMEQGLAKNPASSYYKSRVKQDTDDIIQLRSNRQAFFDSLQDNITAEWIQNQKAILGLEQIDEVYDQTLSSFTKASQELFGMDDVGLKKWAGYCLAFTVEVGIILLALLGFGLKKTPVKKCRNTRKKKTTAEDSTILSNRDITSQELSINNPSKSNKNFKSRTKEIKKGIEEKDLEKFEIKNSLPIKTNMTKEEIENILFEKG